MKRIAALALLWGLAICHLPTPYPVDTSFPSSNPSPPVAHAAMGESFLAPQAGCASDEKLRRRMIDLINTVRAQTRSCGPISYDGAPPVRWNDTLARAAHLHSFKMASENFFDHRWPDSTHVGIRVQDMGYNWRFVGENIYAGIETVSEAVYGWLDSEGHCKTIMNPDYTEIGAACVENRASQYVQYWTQVFASPF